MDRSTKALLFDVLKCIASHPDDDGSHLKNRLQRFVGRMPNGASQTHLVSSFGLGKIGVAPKSIFNFQPLVLSLSKSSTLIGSSIIDIINHPCHFFYSYVSQYQRVRSFEAFRPCLGHSGPRWNTSAMYRNLSSRDVWSGEIITLLTLW